MAFVSVHQPLAAPVLNRVANAYANFRQARQDNRTFRKTLTELRSLSDYELNDLGLSRLNLIEVARESVFNK